MEFDDVAGLVRVTGGPRGKGSYTGAMLSCLVQPDRLSIPGGVAEDQRFVLLTDWSSGPAIEVSSIPNSGGRVVTPRFDF